MSVLRNAVGDALGCRVSGMTRLGGGDVAESYRVELEDGRRAFAKTHRAPPPGFFTTEAAGLRWLHDAGALAVPEVLAAHDGDHDRPPMLVLEWIEGEGRGQPDEAQRAARLVGRVLRVATPPTNRTSGARCAPRRRPPRDAA